MLKSVATLAFVIALAGSAATPTLQQSLSMKQPIGVRISPDGRYVAYLVQQANWDENAFNSQIWIADTASNERYQLTFGKKQAAAPGGHPIPGALPSPPIVMENLKSTLSVRAVERRVN